MRKVSAKNRERKNGREREDNKQFTLMEVKANVKYLLKRMDTWASVHANYIRLISIIESALFLFRIFRI